MSTMSIPRGELLNVFGVLDRALKSDASYPQEFFYFLRKNREKIRSEVTAIQETNDKALEKYRAKLKEENAIVVDGGTARIVDADKFNSITKEYEPVLVESDAFLKSTVDIDTHVWSRKFPDGFPARSLDTLITWGFVLEPVEG